jgi:hypothetical protein
VHRELGLDIAADRFWTVNHYTFVWDRRHQPPVDHGTADVSIVMSAALTDDELAAIRFDKHEYSAMRLVDVNAIVDEHNRQHSTAAASAVEFHPALRQAVLDYRSSRTLQQLLQDAARDDNVVSDREIRQRLLQWASSTMK